MQAILTEKIEFTFSKAEKATAEKLAFAYIDKGWKLTNEKKPTVEVDGLISIEHVSIHKHRAIKTAI